MNAIITIGNDNRTHILETPRSLDAAITYARLLAQGASFSVVFGEDFHGEAAQTRVLEIIAQVEAGELCEDCNFHTPVSKNSGLCWKCMSDRYEYEMAATYSNEENLAKRKAVKRAATKRPRCAGLRANR